MATIDGWLFVLKLVSALGCGLIAGAFFAFSSFVMKALSRLPASEGMAAMQSINVVVLNPVFLGVFVGTAALCAAGLVVSFLRWHEPGVGYLLAGSLLYVAGTFLVTMMLNVPLNNALAAVAPPPSARGSRPSSARDSPPTAPGPRRLPARPRPARCSAAR